MSKETLGETEYLAACLSQGLRDLSLSGETDRKLVQLAGDLVRENEKYNLTAITSFEEIALLHFADSLSLSAFLPAGASLLDVGSGAGFPSLPLAAARPDLKITALDSTGKKTEWIAAEAGRLGLSNVTAVCGRAEEVLAPGNPLRESFDFVTARAVARLGVLCELCSAGVRQGGSFIAMKGSSAAGETAGMTKAKLATLSLSAPKTESFDLVRPETGERYGRTLLIFGKTGPLPPKYPRSFAKIKKSPLF